MKVIGLFSRSVEKDSQGYCGAMQFANANDGACSWFDIFRLQHQGNKS
jgi:hypothetical protein